jgi:hypothetical protein
MTIASTSASFERPKDRSDELRARNGAVRFLDVPEHRFVMVDDDPRRSAPERLRTILRQPDLER